MSDEMFKTFYRAASAKFGKVTHRQNGYGSLMSGASNNYGNASSAYSQYGISSGYNMGFGNMLSGRKY